MRLIDADALMPRLEFIREAEHQIFYGKESWGFVSKCITTVDDAPTIEPEPCEDAVSRADVEAEIANILKGVFVEYQDIAKKAAAKLPSVQPEWNNHTVACLLAELFDDTCACNYNGIDEWLPEKCELLDACPNPVGVACWEQYLKHRAERREE